MTTDANFQYVPRVSRGSNPFAGIPFSDYLRDLGALALLLISLALPWNFRSVATAHVDVILITLLSIVSLSITYLSRAGVFPSTFTVRKLWLLRLAANAPYLILVLVYLIIDAVAGNASTAGTAGVGYAVAYGLAGALLAAQPRQAEIGAMPRGDPASGLWYRIAVGYGAIAVLCGLLSLIFLLTLPSLGSVEWSALTIAIISLLLNLVALALVFGGIVRRNEVGRIVALSVGLILVVEILIDLVSNKTLSGGGAESIHYIGYGAVFLVGAVGLASAPPLRLAMNPVAPLQRSFSALATLFLAAACIAGVVLLMTVLAVVSGATGLGYVGFGIGSIVILVVYILAAVIARTTLRSDPASSRNLVLGLTGVMFVLGIIHVTLASAGAKIGIIDLFFAFGLPIAIVVFLLLPAAVRQFYASVAAAGTAGAAGDMPLNPVTATTAIPPSVVPTTTFPTADALATAVQSDASTTHSAAQPSTIPLTPAPPTPPTASGFTAAEALDPATDPQMLFRIAKDEPSLRAQLAANPSTYPELVAWLGQFDDPEIQRALKARKG